MAVLENNGIVLVDLDDTLTNLVEAWVGWLNDRYNLSLTEEDITSWDIYQFFPDLSKEQVREPLLIDSFWETVKPIDGSRYYLNKLYQEGYDIYIVTATDYRALKTKVEQLINVYFPFIDADHIIVTNNKQLVIGDILIDDNINNLIGGTYNKLLFRQPHNYSIDVSEYAIGEADGWEDCYNKIHNILPTRLNFV